MEDNESTIAIIRSGKNPTMRHIQRTHDVSVKWLSDQFKILKHRLKLINCDTNEQSADIFTKAFDNKDKWTKVCQLIGFGGFKPLTSERIPKLRGGFCRTRNASQNRDTTESEGKGGSGGM